MSNGNDAEQDAGFVAYGLRALVATVIGAIAGVALQLGDTFTGAIAGALLGGALGLGIASGVFAVSSARVQLQQKNRITELETIDRLTGLPNGKAMRTWLERHLPRANEVQSHTALLVIHGEGIDLINESHGREVGDELLKALVARTRSCLLDKDHVFRAGGTDIAVIRTDLAGTHAAEELAESILGLLSNPYEVDGELLRVPVCIGLAVAGGRPTTADDMLRDAEVATFRATTKGPGSLIRFEQAMVESLTPATAEHRLRTALERGDFQVTYLPVFSLTTGEVVEVEALLRWIDEGRGMVAAEEFLTAMEQTGIIVPVGTWVIQEVCRQATYWARTFPSHRPVRVTANLSRRQLLQADFNEVVASALDDAETDPTRVILEVNERSLTDQREDLWSVLRRCKDMGLAVSLDDLGAANSSLATLRRFQLDQVKIDQSFVKTVMASAEDAAVIRHVTALCRELGIKTVAKAVQAEDQAQRLCQLGVEHALGRYFSEPVTPGQIDELIYTDLTRPRPAVAQTVPAAAPAAPAGPLLPTRTPGAQPTPVEAARAEPARAEPVVVPDLAASRQFPRRSAMFS
jgi:diguanylate cyclase (GGDEF)-like protein